jgi:hypothetical protein
MSRTKRTSAFAGITLALALAVTPAAQAAGPVLPFPASWLETGFDRLAGWWEQVTMPRRSAPTHAGVEKIGMTIGPNGAQSPAPPPPNASRDISGAIDPNG